MNNKICKNQFHQRLGRIFLKEQEKQNLHTGTSVREA